MRNFVQLFVLTCGLTFAGLGLTQNMAYANAMHSHHEVIKFDPGSSTLTEAQKTMLRNLVNTAGLDQINKAHVVAWSDKAFSPKADLPKASRDLAQDRIDAINDFLKDDLKVSNTDTYSMAERSNWVARTFNTKDAELKSVFGQKGAQPVLRKDFETIKRVGGPSKAVVVLQMKGDTESTNMTAPDTNY